MTCRSSPAATTTTREQPPPFRTLGAATLARVTGGSFRVDRMLHRVLLLLLIFVSVCFGCLFPPFFLFVTILYIRFVTRRDQLHRQRRRPVTMPKTTRMRRRPLARRRLTTTTSLYVVS